MRRFLMFPAAGMRDGKTDDTSVSPPPLPVRRPLRRGPVLRCKVTLAALLLAPLTVSAQILEREVAWLMGGSIHTRWSMQDAFDQGLSLKATGTDWHSHQIDLRRKTGQSLNDQIAPIHGPAGQLCADSQGVDDWTALRCQQFRTTAADVKGGDCDSHPCFVIQLAPFVLKDKALFAAVEHAAQDPCSVIPSYPELQAKYRERKPRGGFAYHTANVSEYWLYCDTDRPVKGRISSGENPDQFVVHFFR
jgi:hypothetical protein